MNQAYGQLVVLSLLLTFFTGASAQVPVHQEPRHQPVYQDKNIRVLDVRMLPGDTSLYHVHTTPSLFIWFTRTSTGSQLAGGPASYGQSVPGRVLFENLAPPHTRTHRVWNTDTGTFHVMDVELLYPDPGFVQAPLQHPGLQLATDTSWVRAYRLRLEQGQTFQAGKRNYPLLLVALTAARIETRQKGKRSSGILKPGGFISVKARQTFYLMNPDETAAQFVLLEFPVQ